MTLISGNSVALASVNHIVVWTGYIRSKLSINGVGLYYLRRWMARYIGLLLVFCHWHWMMFPFNFFGGVHGTSKLEFLRLSGHPCTTPMHSGSVVQWIRYYSFPVPLRVGGWVCRNISFTILISISWNGSLATCRGIWPGLGYIDIPRY